MIWSVCVQCLLQGGGIRSTNGALLLYNSSVVRCRGLSTSAGVYMESTGGLDMHMEGMRLSHNVLTGRGGAFLAEMVEDDGHLNISIHNSVFTHNTVSGGPGGGDLHTRMQAHAYFCAQSWCALTLSPVGGLWGSCLVQCKQLQQLSGTKTGSSSTAQRAWATHKASKH